MVNPEVHCCGTDIDAGEIAVARERAKLYNVADRCEFHHVAPSLPLPFSNASFDFSLCSSVLEYAIEPGVRRFCVQEMVRLVNSPGLMFFAVPNRLYPFEIHTGKWGWNYFPRWLKAQTVDVTFWEVRKLAQPYRVKLHDTPMSQLLRPWSAFCLIKNEQ
jgi:SAM-dependent methyltransferase